MLQGKNIQIFKITDKKPSAYNSIELSLHKPVPYLQATDNKVFLANEFPFSNYKVGDYLAVDLDKTCFLICGYLLESVLYSILG